MNTFLYEILQKQFGITKDQFQPLDNILHEKKYKKGELILKETNVEANINFVKKGIVHQYVIMNEGVHTVDVKLQGMAFNSLKSYANESPSDEIQEAITDVILVYFKKIDFEKLMKEYLWCFVYMKSIEQIFVNRENRTLLLQHKNAADRFRIFMDTDPNSNRLLLEVPQKLLANYLAMAPETFSKVKKQYFTGYVAF
ncbi:Crp/Fnr family transcriptional regulator [Wenyingzhuangia sp. IMCC45533]